MLHYTALFHDSDLDYHKDSLRPLSSGTPCLILPKSLIVWAFMRLTSFA